ncbi:hypothetical protein D3C85_1540480 [compost metagenome]
MIELAVPVTAHDEGIDAMLANVIDLLFPRVLRDHQVDATERLDDLLALGIGDQRLLALQPVELVGGHRDYRPLAQLAHTLEQAQMADMEHIEGTVGDDGSQR